MQASLKRSRIARATGRQAYAPRRLTLAIANDEQGLPGLLAAREPKAAVTAYVCSGHSCLAPITNFEELDTELKRTEVASSG